MKYSISTILKGAGAILIAGIGAAVAAANGQGLEHLDLGQWLLAAGAGLTAGAAAFKVPSLQESKVPKPVPVAANIAEASAAALLAHQQLTDLAVNSVKQVQEAAGVLPTVAQLGPMAEKIIAQFEKGVK